MYALRKPFSWHACFRDASGAAAIEYAVLGSLVFLAIIGAVRAVGPAVSGMFNAVAAAF
jgi:Flp pilus assembly pilin Flp